jgi:hypothetical protein
MLYGDRIRVGQSNGTYRAFAENALPSCQQAFAAHEFFIGRGNCFEKPDLQ